MVIYGDVGKQTSLPFKEIHIYIYTYCVHNGFCYSTAIVSIYA